MNFYQALNIIQDFKDRSKIIDLSTGDPYVPASIKEFLLDKINHLSKKKEISKIFSYNDYGGSKFFLDKFRITYENTCDVSLADHEIIVTPGAQAALYYLQKIFSKPKMKLLYPVNYEYCGAFNFNENYNFSCDLSDFLSGKTACDMNSLSRINWGEISAVFISQPHNPTSTLWSNDRLLLLAKHISPYNVYLVIDETYALPFAPLFPSYYRPITSNNIIHIYSFSKVGLAGERIGAIVSNNEIISQIQFLQKKLVIQTSKIGQLLAGDLIDYLSSDSDISKQFGLAYKSRWENCVNILNECKLTDEIIFPPDWGGGPFLWIKCKSFLTEDKIFHMLLTKGVAIMPSFILSVQKKKSTLPAFRIGLGGNPEQTLNGINILSEVLLQAHKEM